MRIFIFAVVILLSTSMVSFAQDENCIRIIEVSKEVNITSSNKSEVKQHAENFCKEYKLHEAEIGTYNFGASFDFLSASFGSSGGSVKDVANRYCSLTDSMSAVSDTYNRYISAIAPGAFQAVENCMIAKKQNITYDLQGSPLPDSFRLTAAFIAGGVDANPAEFEVKASAGVKCQWNDTWWSSKKKIPTGGQAILSCNREDTSKKGEVTVLSTNYAAVPATSIPWRAYDKEGNPKDTITSLLAEIKELKESRVNSVVAFDSETCPNGWDPYEPAYGRFIRGIDKTKQVDPDGMRKPGNPQDDTFEAHDHKVHLDTAGPSGATFALHVYPITSLPASEKISPAGGKETRPKNVALLYCVRR